MRLTNKIRLAAGGAGKTTAMIHETAAAMGSSIAILTYTNNNYAEIVRMFYREYGSVPAHITIYTWYRFLLQECIRPYQRCFYDGRRIESIFFVQDRSMPWAGKNNVEAYYICHERYIYSDKASQFALECAERSGGQSMRRLGDMFDHIYVDEVQDMAGYDLDLIECFIRAGIGVSLIGDVRQATYSTNPSPKNSQYRGVGMRKLFMQWEKQGLSVIDDRAESHRCNQSICDLADSLYPAMPRTVALNNAITGHDGLFLVPSTLVADYVHAFAPTVMRHDARTDCRGHPSVNFGDSKGKTFDRILIFPNGPLKSFLSTGDITKITAPSKYYVAFTRARYSVAFAHDGACKAANVNVYAWPVDKPRPFASR